MSNCFLDASLLDELVAKARSVPRLRSHHNLHLESTEPAHRLLVAIEPDSYVRPHCHLDPNKSETIIPLRGRLGALVLDGEGKVLEARVIAPEAGSFGFHVPAGVFHSIVALESGTVFIEIKAGPYAVPVAAEWGQWAPAEGEPGVAGYLAEMKGAFTVA